jgi:hypothetical protein
LKGPLEPLAVQWGTELSPVISVSDITVAVTATALTIGI